MNKLFGSEYFIVRFLAWCLALPILPALTAWFIALMTLVLGVLIAKGALVFLALGLIAFVLAMLIE